MNYRPTDKTSGGGCPATPTGSGLTPKWSELVPPLYDHAKLARYEAFQRRLEHERRSGVNVTRTTEEILKELEG